MGGTSSLGAGSHPTPLSPPFSFLAAHDPLLVTVAEGAWRYALTDPAASLVKQRTLAELLAQGAAAYTNVDDRSLDQAGRIRALAAEGVLDPDVRTLFDAVRRAGNDAAHAHTGTPGAALHGLKLCRELAVWYVRAFGGAPDFRPPPLLPPPDPSRQADHSAGLQAELDRLRLQVAGLEDEVVEGQAMGEAQSARLAEARAATEQAQADAEAAFALAEETEVQKVAFARDLDALRARQTPADAKARVVQAARAGTALRLDEAATRRLIDGQLRDAGWEADSEALRYSTGTRPEKGPHLAIAEWPTETGPADYVLFAGLTPLAVVEAKRESKDVSGDLAQATRYSAGYLTKGDEALAPGSPFDGHRVPFLFATNGRPYLKQIETKSGIWFRDARQPTNRGRALHAWYSPDGLQKLLAQDIPAADVALRDAPVDLPWLRPYQRDAVEAVEQAIADGCTEALVAMATGTGKTRTALALLYRLVKMGRFRRVLFLVDRTSLGEQARDKFEEVGIEGALSFSDIFDVKDLGASDVEPDTRLHIATVQSMVHRTLRSDDALPVDAYDCIVVDEAHRGYVLDREMSDAELDFRSEAEYVSQYRRIIEYFDAVRIALTATPALHTTEIFGRPVFEYGYRQAVIDGYLRDHLPPTRITTRLAEDGIHWTAGEEVSVVNPATGGLDRATLPDDVDVDVEDFNRRVVTENFNRAVLGVVAREIDPDLPGKTIVYCVNDAHADLAVKVFKDALDDAWGPVRDDVVQKITGAADKPKTRILHFKNEAAPKIAVTVDLLTTGIDVPEVVNLVFLRRVRSRILFEQMLGRATRLAPDLYGPGVDKEFFRVFDAVGVYEALQDYTDMKPVVTTPGITFEQLADEAAAVSEPDALYVIADQALAKLQRRRSALMAHADAVEAQTGFAPAALLALADSDPAALRRIVADPATARFLDTLRQPRSQAQILSEHDDEVVRVETGYGASVRPEDYIASFGAWIASHRNEIPALVAVTQRPASLTRADLRALALELDRAGFSELTLRTAWHETTNQDVAATIIGFIRTKALGSPLIPYADRVKAGLARVLASHAWSGPQKQWLARLAQQVEKNVVVDRKALDEAPFHQSGGLTKLNTVFDGRAEEVLAELEAAVWADAA